MKTTKHFLEYSAGDVAGNPELYNKICFINKLEWECMGYSNSGRTIKFSRIIPLATNKLLVKNKYLKVYHKVMIEL